MDELNDPKLSCENSPFSHSSNCFW